MLLAVNVLFLYESDPLFYNKYPLSTADADGLVLHHLGIASATATVLITHQVFAAVYD